MKYGFLFLMVVTAIICSRLNAQSVAYPVTGIGMDPGMTVLGRWQDEPFHFPDGEMKAGEYATIDISPELSNKEKKKYGKSPVPEIKLYYNGGMKNNRFHGWGTLRFSNRNSGFSDWAYTGEFVNGRAEGMGELSCFFFSTKVTSTEYCYFRGEFINGLPVEGNLIHLMHLEKKKTPVLFYSGQVFWEWGKIGFHGFGTLSFTEMQHSNPKFHTGSRLPGALYCGQFYRGSATGFAIANLADSSGRPGPLATILSGADDVFQQYNNLGLYADFVAGSPYTPPAGKPAVLYKLYPRLDSAVYKELALDNGIVYKGMVLNNLPYGLGYVEYPGEKGNYRDVGWWRQGKKLSVEQLLKNMLPDSNWITPKKMPVYVNDCMHTRIYRQEQKTVSCSKKQTEGLYFGPLSAQGFPVGWGIFYPALSGEKSFKPLLGKFSGTDLRKDTTANLAAELLYMYCFNQQTEYHYYDPAKAAGDQFYGDFDAGVFDQCYPVVPQSSYKRNFRRIAFAEELFTHKRHVEYVSYERNYAKMLSARPSLQVASVHLNKSSNYQNYVLDTYGNKVELIYTSRDEIKRGDYVFLGKALYPVHDSYRNIMLGKSPSDGFWMADHIPANVLVVRGYTITNIEYELAYCSGCSNLQSLPTEPVTITGSAHSGRYQTNVYQNNSGSGTIVSKPIYNEISITLPPPTRKPCKVCNDNRKYIKAPLKVIEL